MKTLSIFLSLINSLLAGVILLASLGGNIIPPTALLWSLTKSFALLGVIFTGGVTWFGILTGSKPGMLVVNSLALIVLGTAAIVWTFHLAAFGQADYGMAIYGVSLMIQGLASLFSFAEEGRQITVA